MIGIYIDREGRVTGDIGFAVTYSGSASKCRMKIHHPDSPNAIYYLYVEHCGIPFRIIVNDNDEAVMPITQAGIPKFQFIAVDKYTEEVLFTSRIFELVIRKSYNNTILLDSNYRLQVDEVDSQLISVLKEEPIRVIEDYDCDNLFLPGYYYVMRNCRNLPSDKSDFKMNIIPITDGVCQTIYANNYVAYRLMYYDNGKTEWQTIVG